MLNRRDFLRSSSLLALSPTVPVFLARTAAAGNAGAHQRVLVVVQLDGGNDALNTVVPLADDNVARLRPNLAMPRADLIRVNDTLGLHPALRPLGGLLEAGHLAILPGVGYPNPSRSHFTGMAVWNTARLDRADHTGYGWLGRAPSTPPSVRRGQCMAVCPKLLRGRGRSRANALMGMEEMQLANATAARQAAGPETADALLAFVRRQRLDGYAAGRSIGSRGRQPRRCTLSGDWRGPEAAACGQVAQGQSWVTGVLHLAGGVRHTRGPARFARGAAERVRRRSRRFLRGLAGGSTRGPRGADGV